MTLHATAQLAGYRGSLPTERIRLRVWDLFFRMQISAPDVIGIRVDIEMRLVRVHDGRLDHLVDLIEAFPQIPEHAGQVFLVFDVEAGLSLFVVDPLYPGPGPLRDPFAQLFLLVREVAVECSYPSESHAVFLHFFKGAAALRKNHRPDFGAA